jgi:hypothetical protein
MTIFIPVLLICLNGNCEFMQTKTYYRDEVQCRAVLEEQKQHMQNVSRGKSEVLEGTCIEADVKTTRGQTL